MQINVCVLRSGGEYNESHVLRLSKQVPNLHCISDTDIELTKNGIKVIKLECDWPKWWAKIFLFSPTIKDDLFYIDLDTLVIKMPEMPSVTTVLTDFGDKNVIASGLMYIKHEDKQVVWDAFIKDPQKAMSEHIKWPAGDGGFINRFYNKCQRWQDVSNIYSWKYHCSRGIPSNADIVCFHGRIRPWDLGL